ncbi:MAG: serine hydroxymethyltransferase, partial [Methanophagales archaeon ANME-1-THS]
IPRYAEKIDKMVFPGIQGGPLMHAIAAKAVAFNEALSADFIVYQNQIVKNAKILANELMINGFDLVSGGTDNHLMLVDLTKTDLTGKEAEEILGKVGIIVNIVPGRFETRKPFITSGIRLGTPAVTTRGMREKEMKFIGACITKSLYNTGNIVIQNEITDAVRDLGIQFPLFNGEE